MLQDIPLMRTIPDSTALRTIFTRVFLILIPLIAAARDSILVTWNFHLIEAEHGNPSIDRNRGIHCGVDRWGRRPRYDCDRWRSRQRLSPAFRIPWSLPLSLTARRIHCWQVHSLGGALWGREDVLGHGYGTQRGAGLSLPMFAP